MGELGFRFVDEEDWGSNRVPTLFVRLAECPVCGTPFSSDDIVRCADCDTPHHQDCWIYNEGCAVNGCGKVIQERSPEEGEAPEEVPLFLYVHGVALVHVLLLILYVIPWLVPLLPPWSVSLFCALLVATCGLTRSLGHILGPLQDRRPLTSLDAGFPIGHWSTTRLSQWSFRFAMLAPFVVYGTLLSYLRWCNPNDVFIFALRWGSFLGTTICLIGLQIERLRFILPRVHRWRCLHRTLRLARSSR